MSDDRRITDLVRAVVAEQARKAARVAKAPAVLAESSASPEDVKLAKRAAVWMGAEIPPPPMLGSFKPSGDRAHYLKKTPARLGVGRTGTRYLTGTVLSFLVDHAAARDAVASSVDPQVIRDLGLVAIESAARDKREFLARPDLGRKLSSASADTVRKVGLKSPQVQIVAVDGLSATALTVNLPLVLPALLKELANLGIRTGTHFAVSNGRVAAGDEVARLTGAEVLCLLVGERPGLKTAESMGAYITYMRVQHFSEAMRNVVSNIHKNGLIPSEAAVQIAGIIRSALANKKTGVDIKA